MAGHNGRRWITMEADAEVFKGQDEVHKEEVSSIDISAGAIFKRDVWVCF